MCVVIISVLMVWIVYNDNSNSFSELKFTISLSSTQFNLGEPLIITANLTNEGTESINVSQLEIGTLTIDFLISTPDGENIHYLGPFFWHIPHTISIEPNESYLIFVNIANTSYNFGNEKDISEYTFTSIGEYSIQAIYKSGQNANVAIEETVWIGTLTSNTLTFIISS